MVLASGTRLGPYEILAAIGAGGMGEVYRAHDTKLNRDVAIKVLPESVSRDPERLARFHREAQALAALNHLNIAHVYGIEDATECHALVMELVQGPTLAERISRGPFSIADTLSIARQIVDAVGAAHEQGVVHRDLKPANIKVREDGTVKVLDFGLAKLAAPEASGAGTLGLSQSPTLTSPAATLAGVILGTAAYMSPEQATGKPADKRADIWAFGVVLWEMLTGVRLFDGETVSHTLAFVLTREPDWTTLPATVPPSIKSLLRRCLEKDRKRRLSDIADARFELEEASSPSSAIDVQKPASRQVETATRHVSVTVLPWVVAGVLAVGFVGVLVRWAPWRQTAAATPVYASVEIGADTSLVTGGNGAAAILSPDAKVFAFVAQSIGQGPGTAQLYVRHLDQLRATPLSGTDGAHDPFFSPDGQWLAFFTPGKLKKISVTGGAAVTLCDAGNGRGGSWSDDGTIVFQASSRGDDLLRVSAAGGQPEPAVRKEGDELLLRWPQLLPGGRGVLYTATTSGVGNFEDANLVVKPSSGGRKVLMRGGHYARYVNSGHIVYLHEGTLFAAPFSLERLELTGPSVPVVEGVTSNPGSGGAQFDVSRTGALVYLSGPPRGGNELPIHWMDRTGKTSVLRPTPATWGTPHFAPDGRRLAVTLIPPGSSASSVGGFVSSADIWIYEWERDTLTRLTTDPASDIAPVWTPDSRRIAFGSTRSGNQVNIYWQRADGTGEVQRLTDSPNPQLPDSFHPSGKFLALHEGNPTSGQQSIKILPIEGDEASGWKPGKPTVFRGGPFLKAFAIFSPDGRWIAYDSNDTGQYELYVEPFPGPGGRWQISSGGANTIMWSRTKRELFYSTGNGPGNQLMVVPYAVEGETFRAEKPRPLSETRINTVPTGITLGWNMDIHPDGQRFAVAAMPETPAATTRRDKVVFVFNFFDELRRLAPATKK